MKSVAINADRLIAPKLGPTSTTTTSASHEVAPSWSTCQKAVKTRKGRCRFPLPRLLGHSLDKFSSKPESAKSPGRSDKCGEIFIQKRCCKVRLRVKIGNEYATPELRKHPCHVIHERGLADTSFIVEEREHGCSHGRLRIVARIQFGSITNSRSGFPFLASASRAV